jgi:hypothetical protein
MQSTYHNLGHERDWEMLYVRLLGQSRWCDEPHGSKFNFILNTVFGGELHNATIFLLHGLTPVRFAFLDGQARMSSLYYYERKLLPSLLDNFVPLSSIPESDTRWSLSTTSVPAFCRIVANNNHAAAVSNDEIALMKKHSKKEMLNKMLHQDALNTMAPTNLSDFISDMLSAEMKSFQPIVANDMPAYVKSMFLKVLKHMKTFDTRLAGKLFRKIKINHFLMANDDEYAKAVLEKLDPPPKPGKKELKRYKSLVSAPRGESPELTLMMYILGTTLSNQNCMKYMKRCIDREWVGSKQNNSHVHDIAMNKIHPGTVVNAFQNQEWREWWLVSLSTVIILIVLFHFSLVQTLFFVFSN